MTPQFKKTLVRVGAAVVFMAVFLWLMWGLKSVTTILMVALFLAYILNPVVQRLTTWGLGRAAASFLLLCIGGGLMVGFLIVIVPAAVGEIVRFATAAPEYLGALQKFLLESAQRFGITVPGDWNQVATLVVQKGKQFLPGLADSFSRVATSILRSTLGAIAIGFYVLLVPILAYYLMVSFDDMKEEVRELIPHYAREQILGKLGEIDSVLASFIRGQLTVALILGILYSVGFLVIGIDLALVLGILSGVLWIIPYVGTLFGLVGGVLMAVAKYGDLLHIAYVVGWIALVQLVESNILTPRIVGQAIGLHPVVYILAVIVGANLFGFVGMLVAIPVAAILKVLLVTAVDAYKASVLYAESPGDQSEQ